MPLPNSPRVVFKKNPLYAVTSVLRFPTILRIQAESPVAFQDAVRQFFPIYSVLNGLPIELPSDMPAEVQSLVRANLQKAMSSNVERFHKFSTFDENWTVQLSQSALVLQVKNYSDWANFREKVSELVDHFQLIYAPAFYSSISLRYQNAIRRMELGLDGTPWSELLKPFVAAELSKDCFSESEIVSCAHNFEIKFSDSEHVQIQHGLGTHTATNEPVYVIDGNFFSKTRTNHNDVLTKLTSLNAYSGQLFRACITDTLFHALEPLDANV